MPFADVTSTLESRLFTGKNGLFLGWSKIDQKAGGASIGNKIRPNQKSAQNPPPGERNSGDAYLRKFAFSDLVNLTGSCTDLQATVVYFGALYFDCALINHSDRLGGTRHQSSFP